MTNETKADIRRKAEHLEELADQIQVTRDSSTTLDLVRDMRKTARELRELTARQRAQKAPANA